MTRTPRRHLNPGTVTAALAVTTAFLLGACQLEPTKVPRPSQQSGPTADALPQEGTTDGGSPETQARPDSGCADPASAAFTLDDSAGGSMPACGLLTETDARLALFVPAREDCLACTVAATAAAQTSGLTVVLVLPAGSDVDTLALAGLPHNLLTMIDGDSRFADMLAGQGLSWDDAVAYALSHDKGSYLHYSDLGSFIASLRQLLPAEGGSTFDWDGLSNRGAGGWDIR